MRNLRKATTLVGAIVMLTTALTVPLKAGSIAVGLAGEATYITATGQETLKGGLPENNGKVHTGHGAAASIFAQYTFQDDGFVIGIERIPNEVSLGNIDRDTRDNLKAHGGASPSIVQHVEAALKNHTTVYFETPGLGGGGSGGLYLTGGWTQVDLLTKEALGSGSSYPDADVDGYTLGIGIKTGTDAGMLAKISAEYTDYDNIQLTSTGSDTASTIDATLDTYSIKVSVGYSF